MCVCLCQHLREGGVDNEQVHDCTACIYNTLLPSVRKSWHATELGFWFQQVWGPIIQLMGQTCQYPIICISHQVIIPICASFFEPICESLHTTATD